MLGVIINHYPVSDDGTLPDPADRIRSESRLLRQGKLHLIGAIPQNDGLTYPRTIDIQRHLKAEVLNAGEMEHRRVKHNYLVSLTVPNSLFTLVPGAILLAGADRNDVIVAVAMTALSKVPIAGLILTGDIPIDQRMIEFCRPALATGLPLLRVRTNSYDTATQLSQLSSAVPADDLERTRAAVQHVAQALDAEWLINQSKKELGFRLSPAAFLHQLTEKARAANRRIVLPEGAEPRTVKAAFICSRRGIARCALLGKPQEVQAVAKSQDLELSDSVEILDPALLRPNYVIPLYEARKHKGLSMEMAASQLEDNVVLGTMMLALGEVDGLVSGAVHSTANTIRPALQIIKTKPNAHAVSSIFFMCLPEQVLVYGDCAVIPDPDVETLADIAIQSADSANAFGIPPRVAMISYSTGESGSGAHVDKVRAATMLAQSKRPDLLIDGPLQYDAAFMPDVAKAKAPNSPVAGRATVFIFPDLNTGNTTYKAVQRSANVISIGPMLQGLRRPVNDLSRGALVDDIVYTIALTAIQATQG
jgi:phosphate acetyltransferase